jgi:hypothetical protein
VVLEVVVEVVDGGTVVDVVVVVDVLVVVLALTTEIPNEEIAGTRNLLRVL